MKIPDTQTAIQLCNEGESLTESARQAQAMARLRDLVAYAKAHSPYFRKAYQEIGEDFTLTDLPPTFKKDLTADYSRWVTDPEITLDGVYTYLNSGESFQKLYLSKYSALTTSGTTGNPMPMVRDACHNAVHGALIQTRLLRQVDPDLMTPVRHRVAAVIICDPKVSSYSSFLKMQKAYPEYVQNTLAVPLMEPIEEIVNKLNAFQPDFLSGYPSVMASLAREGRAGRLAIHPKAIACSAEKLTRETYRALREAFGCPVLNNYCSTEGGEAAMSCTEGELHINSDWVIIEPVDQNGRPVPDGEWSSGLYITDLTNYVQPVIRYYMEDRIRILPGKCPCGSALPRMEIQGRTASRILVGEKEVFGSNLIHEMDMVEEICSYQFVQKEDRRFLVRVIPSGENSWETLEKSVADTVQGVFARAGAGPVEITVRDEPPVHNVRGGKANWFVDERKER